MASNRQSPVMVEQSSPPHSFSSPEYALSILSPSTSNQRPSAHSSSSTIPTSETNEQQHPALTTQQDRAIPGDELRMDSTADAEHEDGGDDSSHSDSASDSSVSTETPRTASTPRSAHQDSSEHAPRSDEVPPPTTVPVDLPIQDSVVDNTSTGEIQSADAQLPTGIIEPPTQSLEDAPLAIQDIPEWVKYEEDLSKPNEEELKEIENRKSELDASNYSEIEKDVFPDIDDPDLRPHKKIRLSWVVKGVRGTKEKPNRVRIMASPSVEVDGMFWNIKFFPRGNKSRNSLSAYLRCSPTPPEPSKSQYVGKFKCFECAPDADFSKCEPILNLDLITPESKKDAPTASEPVNIEQSKEQGTSENRQTPEHDDDSISTDENVASEGIVKISSNDDFRVSAQLGLVIYNPAEPRTCFTSSASHQFYPHQDDWGWDTAVSHWEDIHRRKRGQRQALLRNDTLAIDAYVRIYDDPTKALFWHSSPGESQWDSKGLAGFYPFGTRMLYHSPATAGIASWMLLAPFRDLIQGIDAGTWRKDSSSRPRPLIAQLQLALFQMRYMKKEELYVHIDNIIHEITRCHDSFDTVTSFWEAFRRSMDLELNEDPTACEAFSKMFGSRGMSRNLPLLPVENVATFQEGINQGFSEAKFRGSLPDFLPLTLQRQSFDSAKREWRLNRDGVGISEEIDMSEFCTDEDCKFTLYGLIIHEAERTSGKFHSILRPNGPGGKWLAFTDGNGNKVKSYTKKQVGEYELPDDSTVKKSNEAPRMIAMGLYIRTSKLPQYLPGELGSFQLAAWLKPYLEESYYHNPDLFEPSGPSEKDSPIQIELFWDKLVGGQDGKLDLYRLKSNEKARQKQYRQLLSVDRSAAIFDLRTKLASALNLPDKAFKIWSMNYYRLGAVSKAYMYVLPNDSIVGTCLGSNKILNLWLSTFNDKHELEDEILAQNFLKLEGIHIEAPPKAEPETATKKTSNSLNMLDPESRPSLLPDVEAVTNAASHPDTANGETTGQDLQISAYSEAAVTTDLEGVQIEQLSDQLNGHLSEDLSVQDVEQASVEEAMQQTSQDVHPEPNSLEPMPSHNESREEANQPPTIDSVDVNRPAIQSAPSANDAILSTQTAGTEPGSQPGHVEAVTEAGGQADLVNGVQVDEALPPVVHGHLFEASTHEDGQLPLGIPITIGNDQIILVPANHDGISPEDAALISQMIAADLEASERQVINGDDQDEDADSAADEGELYSRPATPRPVIADIYGFLHFFDSVNQKFTAKGTFNVPRDTTISTMVRKQLDFDEDHTFQLWKRDGTFRTTGISLESTFIDVSLTDCCEVIVGDHIGEIRIEALKAEAKFVDPGQLMRHIAMVQREHPVLSTTTEGPIELANFGGDYYKGPLVNGQRHGKLCSVITQSGDSYEGPLLSGQKSGGKGKMIYQNGDVYDGEWFDDQKHGQGEFIEKRTGNRYVGGYENDKRWGKGVTYWEMADQQASLCQVCYFEEVDAVFYKCGHVVACFTCAKQCASDSAGCPVCRKPVEAVVKMYRS